MSAWPRPPAWTGPTVQGLDEAALERRLLAAPERPRDHVQPDYGRMHQELRRKGMTLMLLWEEHRADHADCQTYGYYAVLRELPPFRQAAQALDAPGPPRRREAVHRLRRPHHRAHRWQARPHLRGRAGRFQLHLCLRHAARDDGRLARVDGACAGLLSAACTQLIVPDNPKAMIADANRYEPRANDTVLDFARHYGTSVLPARPCHPQDKAKAESAVQIVERWIMARLRHQQFASVHEVNEAMAPLLARLNDKPFQKLPGSRASAFAEIDAPALLPLPLQRYEMAQLQDGQGAHRLPRRGRAATATACRMRWSGQVLEARITTAAVELLHRGQRVASHARNSRAGRLHHDGRAHAGGAPRAHGVDAPAPDPLGPEHRPGHGRSGDAAAGREQASRARLPRLPGPAVAGQALRQGAAGSGLHAGPAARRLPVPPRARHPDQQPRPERAS